MDWQDERYVRLFTRDTPDWVSWPWQARALLPLLLRKVDRVGQLGLGRSGVRGLSVCVGLPEDVCRVGLDALVDDGAVRLDEQILFVRNFQPAQDATMSNASRVRDHRERKRAKLLDSGGSVKRDVTRLSATEESVSPPPFPPPGITAIKQIEPKRLKVKESDVTPSFLPSFLPSVKPKDSVASPPAAKVAEPFELALSSGPPPPSPGPMSTAKPQRPADLVFEHWRTIHRPGARVFDAKTRKVVEARIAEGFTVDDLKLAIDGCKASPHHQGQNDRGKKYDSLELICRDGAKVHSMQGYLEKVDQKPVITLDQIRRGNQRAEDQGWGEVEKRPVNRTKVIT